MGMSPNNASVVELLQAVPNDERRGDCEQLVALMKDASGCAPRMWGKNMVGFGDHHYKHESGREGDMFEIGFAASKTGLTLYNALRTTTRPMVLQLGKCKLGKCKLGGGCLYIKRLSDVDLAVLKDMLNAAVIEMRAPTTG